MKRASGSSAPFSGLLEASRAHRRAHGCGAYSFEDGAGLAALCADLRPDRVLELGAALGYTACCLASGYEGAHIDTVEGDPVHCALASRHIAEAGFGRRVTLHQGDFASVLTALAGPYGLVFFDGFAPTPDLTAALQDRLGDGGVFVCANLGLASADEAAEVKRLFADPARWRPLSPLEGGATPAWRKLQRGA